MNAVLLRKLTLKSCFYEGKYANVNIKTLIDLGHTAYLRWCYYNLSTIDFIQEIKDKIGITSEFEIEKPGINPDLCNKLNDIKYKNMGLRQKKHFDKKMRVVSEIIYNKTIDKTKKSVLQAINHGKFNK